MENENSKTPPQGQGSQGSDGRSRPHFSRDVIDAELGTSDMAFPGFQFPPAATPLTSKNLSRTIGATPVNRDTQLNTPDTRQKNAGKSTSSIDIMLKQAPFPSTTPGLDRAAPASIPPPAQDPPQVHPPGRQHPPSSLDNSAFTDAYFQLRTHSQSSYQSNPESQDQSPSRSQSKSPSLPNTSPHQRGHTKKPRHRNNGLASILEPPHTEEMHSSSQSGPASPAGSPLFQDDEVHMIQVPGSRGIHDVFRGVVEDGRASRNSDNTVINTHRRHRHAPVGDLTFKSNSPRPSAPTQHRRSGRTEARREVQNRPVRERDGERYIPPPSQTPQMRAISRVSNTSRRRETLTPLPPMPKQLSPYINPDPNFQIFGNAWNEFHQNMTHALDKSNGRIQVLELVVQKRDQELVHLEADKKELEGMIREFRNEKEAVREELEAQVEAVKAETKHTLGDKEVRIRYLESENDQIRDDREAKVKALEEGIDQVRQERDAKIKKLDERTAKLKEVHEKLQEYRETINTGLMNFKQQTDYNQQTAANFIKEAREEVAQAEERTRAAATAAEGERERLSNVNKLAIGIAYEQAKESSEKIELLEKHLEDTREILKREREEVDSLRKQLRDREGSDKSLRELLETTKKVVEGVSTVPGGVQGAVAIPDCEAEKQRLEGMVTKMEAISGGLSILPQSVKILSDAREKELETVLNKVGSLGKSQSSMSDTAKELTEGFQNLTAEMLKIRDEARSALEKSQQGKQLASALSSKEAECEESRSEAHQAKEKITDLESQLHDSELRGKDLELRLAKEAASQDQMLELKQRLGLMSDELRMKEGRLEALRSQLQDKTQEASNDIHATREELIKARAELVAARECSSFSEKIYDKALSHARQEVVGIADSRQQQTQQNIRVLEGKVQEATEKITLLSAESKAREHQLKASEREVEGYRKEVDALTRKVEGLVVVKKELSEKLSASLKEAEKAKRELSKVSERATTEGKGRAVRKQELETLNNQLLQAQADIEKEATRANEESKKVSGLGRQLLQAQADIKMEKTRAKEEAQKSSDLGKQLSQAEKMLEALTSQVKKGEEKNKKDDLETASLRKLADQAEKNLGVANDRLEEHKRKLDDQTREMNEKLEDHKKELDDQAREMEDRCQKLGEQSKMLEELQCRIAKGEADAKTFKSQYEQERQQFDICSRENEDLREQLESTKRKQDAAPQPTAGATVANDGAGIPDVDDNTMGWNLNAKLPLETWRHWDMLVREFLFVNPKKNLARGDRKRVSLLVGNMGKAMSCFHDRLRVVSQASEELMEKAEIKKDGVFIVEVDVDRFRHVLVQSPAPHGQPSPNPPTIAEEKGQRRRAQELRGILKPAPPAEQSDAQANDSVVPYTQDFHFRAADKEQPSDEKRPANTRVTRSREARPLSAHSAYNRPVSGLAVTRDVTTADASFDGALHRAAKRNYSMTENNEAEGSSKRRRTEESSMLSRLRSHNLPTTGLGESSRWTAANHGMRGPRKDGQSQEDVPLFNGSVEHFPAGVIQSSAGQTPAEGAQRGSTSQARGRGGKRGGKDSQTRSRGGGRKRTTSGNNEDQEVGGVLERQEGLSVELTPLPQLNHGKLASRFNLRG